MTKLNILLIEDNEDTLHELLMTLPQQIESHELIWDGCHNFQEAIVRNQSQRYDLIVTDIYVDAVGHKRSYTTAETGAGGTIAAVRARRFTPILAITDGSKPEDFPHSPFVEFADKTNPDALINGLTRLIDTGIPELAKRLHDELDQDASYYLWSFLDRNWSRLASKERSTLERLVRRRLVIHFGRLNNETDPPQEHSVVEGLEFYIYPSISGEVIRLGEILHCKISGEDRYYVVLTPHCHLVTQPGQPAPRADFVLTVRAVDAKEIIRDKHPVTRKNKRDKELQDAIRKRIQGPAGIGQPNGRYWFLPGFLDIPDLYCDFLQINSVPYEAIRTDYSSLAVIDSPFAESLQSAFLSLYSAIGTPSLDPARFDHLIGNDSENE